MRVGVAVRAKQQMTEFVGNRATQDYWDLKLGIVTLGAPRRILVIDTGENRMDGKTEDSGLELVLDGRGKHSQPEIGSVGRFLAVDGSTGHSNQTARKPAAPRIRPASRSVAVSTAGEA